MSWFTEFCLAPRASRQSDAASQVTRRHGPVQHQRPVVSAAASQKDRHASSRAPRRMNVVIPPNLKAGDTFEVSVPVAIPTVAAIPAAPPPPRTPITEAEALCYNLRHSVMCYAILDACLAFLNIFLAYVFWWYCSGVLRFDLRLALDATFAAQGEPYSARRPDLRLVGGEGLEPAARQHLRGHVDPLVFFCRGLVRVVPVPRDHGQVAPLLRERRDAGMVLVLGLLAGADSVLH